MGTVLWILAGLLLALFVGAVGLALLRSLTRPLPPPPPAGEMRKIDLRYQCIVCGLVLRVTAAPDEEPPAPKHCTEDMALIAPVME